MSIFDWRRADSAGSRTEGDTDSVLRIVKALELEDPHLARYVAAFAYVLSRVANADLDTSDVETATMVRLVQRAGRLSESQAVLAVEIANSQNRLYGGTEDFLVTRQFRQLSSEDQRRDLLEGLFAVSAADDAIAAEEEAEIRQIASELGLSHAEYVQTRLKYSGKRTVLRG